MKYKVQIQEAAGRTNKTPTVFSLSLNCNIALKERHLLGGDKMSIHRTS
jgi:hypothetical protein